MAANKVKYVNSGGRKEKKKKTVIKFKNILAQPIPQYWPEISESDVGDLKRILTDIKSTNDNKTNLNEIGITLGMNACLRKVKSGQISCFLISTEIKPKFIINQIICMTLSNYPETKLLCVPNLKTITEQIFGIQSLLLAIYKQKAPLVEEWILKKSENYPIPKELTQYYSKTEKDPIPGTSGTMTETRKSSVEQKKIEKNEDLNDLYLKRPSDRSKRAFIPENAKDLKPLSFEIESKQSTSTPWTDFISFSGETVNTTKEEDVDSDEECEKDKTRLLNVFEKIKSKVNESNSRMDVELEENVQDSNREYAKPVESVSIKKKKRKRRRNSISAPTSHEKQSEQSEPVFKYISLHVNKIQGNPNRKKKRKNKNKK